MEATNARAGQIAGDRRAFIALVLAAAVGAMLGYLVYQRVSTPFVRDRDLSPVAVDLLSLARGNNLELQVPPGGNASNYIQTRSFAIGEDTRQVLYMHPPSSASFEGRLLDEERLEFAVGMDPQVWDNAGDGVQFQVEVRDGNEVDILFDTFVDPKRRVSDRRWFEGSVDLSRYAFREIQLVLRTLPGSSGDFDWAGWAEPRLVYTVP